MRLVAALLAGVAFLVPAAGAVAQDVGARVAVAPGEVLLEVNGLGTVRTRADRVRLTASVTGSGDSEAEAEAAAEAAGERLRQALRRAGVAEADIRGSSTSVFVAPPAPPAPPSPRRALPSPAPPAPPPPPGTMRAPRAGPGEVTATPLRYPRNAFRSIEVTLRDPSRVAAIRAALEAAGASHVHPTHYSLSDERGPRRAARAAALANAREEAEAYAERLNMRVLRIVRVTERLGMDVLSALMGYPAAMRRIQPAGTSEPEVETVATVGVDFALGPR